jgi:predicted alpha/beta hydrolase
LQTIVFASALGVPRYIYFKLAHFFAEHGYTVLTFDYRGVHESQSEHVSGSEIQMLDWGKWDIDAALQWAVQQRDSTELIYVAHSCGGQLLGMAPHATHIDKAIFVASQSGYWKNWPRPYRWGVYLVWSLIPLITPWFQNFPARPLGLSSVNIPSGVARQWAQFGKSPNYLWDHISAEDAKRYRNLSFAIRSVGFSDDLYFGPPASVKALHSYYPAAKIDHQIIKPSDYGEQEIGHFKFLKERFRADLWPDLLHWIA